MAVEQGRGGALDLPGHGEVAKGHLAHGVVQVHHECLGQGPCEALARPALRGQPAQHQDQMQRDHLEPPLHGVGHAPGGVEDGLAGPGHNRAIK